MVHPDDYHCIQCDGIIGDQNERAPHRYCLPCLAALVERDRAAARVILDDFKEHNAELIERQQAVEIDAETIREAVERR